MFCLAKKHLNIKVEDPQLLQFTDICNDLYEYFRNVYEAILLGELFELNERKYITINNQWEKNGRSVVLTRPKS